VNIIEALKEGDDLAFKRVFDEYHEKLYFFVISKTGSAYLAEETIQLAFMKLWSYRNSLNEDLPLSLQLFRIARTTLIDLLRKQNRSASLVSQLSIQKSVQKSNLVEEEIDCKELKLQISRSLQLLPPVRKKVFEMHRLGDKSYAEIARELTISVKTVEMHISKAIKQLRSLLNALLLLSLILKEIINNLHG